MAPRNVTSLPAIVGGRVVPRKNEQPPSPSTTISYDQAYKELKDAGVLLGFPTTTTATTTTIPSSIGTGATGTTKIPGSKGATLPTTPVKPPLSQSLNESIAYKKGELYNLYNKDGSPKYSNAEIDAAALGTAPKAKGFWGGVGRVALGALDIGIIKPLQGIDVGRRIVLSGVKELGDEFIGKGGSWTDFYKQATDAGLTSKELFGINTGNKFFDNVLGFGIDVLADPTTYLTLGTGTAAKVALRQTVKTIGADLTEQIVKDAATQLVVRGTKEAVSEVTQSAAKRIATELGTDIASKEVKLASRAVAVEAAQLAKAQGAKNADDILRASISKYSAIAPRKTLGNKAKASVADSVRQLRDEATLVLRDETKEAFEKRVAQNFIDAATDDKIAEIATKGYAAFTDDIAKQMGIKGGTRFGIGTAKVSIPGQGRIVGTLGKATAGTRAGLASKFPGASGLITGKGSVAGIGQVARWDARTGLSQGTLKGKDAVEAVKLLARDKRLTGLTNAAIKPVRVAVGNLLSSSENKPYLNSVVDIVTNQDVVLRDVGEGAAKILADDAATVTAKVGRPVTETELKFAQAIDSIGNEFADVIDNMRITTSAPAGGKIIETMPRPASWYPETLTNVASTSMADGSYTAQKALEALRLDAPPLPTQNVANALGEGAEWFGHVLSEDDIKLGIKHFNKLANEPTAEFLAAGGKAFKGQFFDQNIGSALRKYADKYAKDFAFLQLIDDASEMAISPDFMTGAAIAGAKAERATVEGAAALRKELGDKLPLWTIDDLRMASRKLETTFEEISKEALTDAQRESLQNAVDEVGTVISTLKTAAKTEGASVADAWAGLGADLADNYAVLFARSPKDTLSYIDNIDPRSLKFMVNVMEDAYVSLGRQIAPDAYVRAELAKIYQNIKQLDDPRVANKYVAFLKDYNNFFKTWVTSTPGFHTRNAISNGFQLLAAGGKIEYLNEGRKIQSEWNKYLKNAADEVAETGDYFLDRPEQLVEDFLNKVDPRTKKLIIPKNQHYAVREALFGVGGSGASDLEEVFGAVTGGRLGIFGKEVSGTGVGSQISEAVGAVPRTSRKAGERIESATRFMLTYDGIRQGLDVQEAVDRTARFLIDYSDLSSVDQIAKQIVPFWMFMSRNLPVQIQNIFTNPGLYQKYEALRREFEDENGNNMLLPDYLTKAGATILGTVPGLGAVYGKPDFGFPGTGSPIPGQEAITDTSLDPLIGSLRPELRTLIEQLRGKESFGNKKIEGFADRTESAVSNLLPLLSTASRYANVGLAGEIDNPIAQALGLKAPGETSPTMQKATALSSLFGVPGGVQTPTVENSRRFDIIRLLEELNKK